MPSDSLQNICALEPGLKRSHNVPPRHHASWLEPSERFDAPCIDALCIDEPCSVTVSIDGVSIDGVCIDAIRAASTDVVSLTDGMSPGRDIALGDVVIGDVVGGPCDIEER